LNKSLTGISLQRTRTQHQKASDAEVQDTIIREKRQKADKKLKV